MNRKPYSVSGLAVVSEDIRSPLWNAIDGYPRVMKMIPTDAPPRWEGYFNGAYKVVPADAIVTLQSERRTLPQVCEDLGVKVVGKDAVVIEASALPKVRNERGMQRFEAGASYADWDDDPEYFEERAREYLALAARLREEREGGDAREPHVTALTELIARDWTEHTGIDASAPDSIARRLVENGVRVEGVES